VDLAGVGPHVLAELRPLDAGEHDDPADDIEGGLAA
jgi:hypothetical protein